MRGPDIQQDALFSTVSPESRVPKDHPLRPIRTMVDTALRKLDTDFNALYSEYGRDSIPPEKLLRAQLLMAFYTIRSERQLMEQIDYNLLFRWFVGFSMDDRVWDHSTFGTHRMTLGADKNYDTKGCVDALRCANVTPHVAQNTSNRSSAIDGRTTHHAGYATSQRFRKRIEECFGWAKTIGGCARAILLAVRSWTSGFVLTMTAYNLVRMRNLGVVAC